MTTSKKAVQAWLPLTLMAMAFCACQPHQKPATETTPTAPVATAEPKGIDTTTLVAPDEPKKKVVAENNKVAILYQLIKPGPEDFDEPIATIWIRDKESQKETKLYQTVEPSGYSWYEPDGKKFYPVPIDSLIATSKISIYNNEPLQIIAEGTINLRNVYSYFIDVPSRKAWLVPANGGYVGRTAEEDYMIFQSYRYCSDPDVFGRYTFLQFFNEKGIMVGAYSFERQHIQKYKSLAE